MASTCIVGLLTPSSSTSLVSIRAGASGGTVKRFVSCSCSFFPSSNEFGYPRIQCSSALEPIARARVSGVLGVVSEAEAVVAKGSNGNVDYENDDVLEQEWKKQTRPCELYVCNLPTSCGIVELLEMLKPFGTVLSVEISRNAETGVSRGCGFVTMSSVNEAKLAVAALDGSDVGGREMRVRFSVDMNPRRRNPEALNSAPKKERVYESPHKLYVGNLPRDVKPEYLRDHFSQFGTLLSARVLHDQKAGKNRCYGFLSFSSAAERDAAISLNGTEFLGRTIVVREGVERTKP
ncbi:hypothetical protein FH972_003733 [Carpinus fangiana]|uniref:RRM domain-containing protein n=1 Tax=Carpinus fangiana TaxID=176857 RepID=A0A5N6QJE4_9ROSI|nr:hypothetical protein FH972_003733 [Carpinus fangiana]